MGKGKKFSVVQWKEIERAVAKAKKRKIDIKAYNRLLVLYMRGHGKNRKEISEMLGFSEQHITEIVSKYFKCGLEDILEDKRTSNNRRLSTEEEEQFLEQFVELAQAGQIITLKGILAKFEEVTGKPSNIVTVYKLLKRHGWRKVKPRPHHPKGATEEQEEASKKLTFVGSKFYWINTP